MVGFSNFYPELNEISQKLNKTSPKQAGNNRELVKLTRNQQNWNEVNDTLINGVWGSLYLGTDQVGFFIDMLKFQALVNYFRLSVYDVLVHVQIIIDSYKY